MLAERAALGASSRRRPPSGVDFERRAQPAERTRQEARRAATTSTRSCSASRRRAASRSAPSWSRSDERFAQRGQTAVTVAHAGLPAVAEPRSADLGWDFSRQLGRGLLRRAARHLLRHDPPARRARPGRRRAHAHDRLLLRRARRAAAREDHGRRHDRVKANALAFLERDIADLWPRRVTAGGASSTGTCSSTADGAQGPRPLRLASTGAPTRSPSERYVLTPAGTVEHRLPSDELRRRQPRARRRLDRNGVDGGCVEAAVPPGCRRPGRSAARRSPRPRGRARPPAAASPAAPPALRRVRGPRDGPARSSRRAAHPPAAGRGDPRPIAELCRPHVQRALGEGTQYRP